MTELMLIVFCKECGKGTMYIDYLEHSMRKRHHRAQCIQLFSELHILYGSCSVGCKLEGTACYEG